MIKQITEQVKAQKAAGAKKVRVILLTTIERNGKQIPQVVNIMEFETPSALLKSGQLASPFRTVINQCEGQYSSFTVERLKSSLDNNEDGAFERS